MDQSDKLVTMLPKIQNGHSRASALKIRIETTRCSQASVRASHRNFEDATLVATVFMKPFPPRSCSAKNISRHSNCSYCDRRQQFEGLSPIHCHCGRYLGGACHSQLEGSLNYFANVTFPPMSLASDFDNVTFDLIPSYWQLNIWHIFNFGWIFAAPQFFLKSGVGREQWQ